MPEISLTRAEAEQRWRERFDAWATALGKHPSSLQLPDTPLLKAAITHRMEQRWGDASPQLVAEGQLYLDILLRAMLDAVEAFLEVVFESSFR